MEYKLITEGERSFVECMPGELIRGERDALDLVAACGENGTHFLLLHAENLTPEFFDLRTRLAGEILLKLGNYTIQTALVLNPGQVGEGKFKEWVLETNRGREFRVFFDRAAAVEWLASVPSVRPGFFG